MAEVIKMPRLSDTMTEGVIAAWHKNVGDSVKKGELLAEIETDKAVQELESYKDGVLLYIGVPNGGKLQVDSVLAILGEKGEDISGLTGGGAKPAEAPKPEEKKPEAPATEPAKIEEKKAEAPTKASSTLDLTKVEEAVLMPRLSDTMTEGVIAAWNKNVGDTVKKGEVLAEIETDKATMDLESYKDGKLLFQGAKAGEKIQVNDLLCIIGADGFDIAPIVAAAKQGGGVSDGGGQMADDSQKPATETAPSTPPTANNQPPTSSAPAPQIINDGRILASPLAKKIAEEKGIDLRYVKGTADGGRIVKSDVDSFVPTAAPAAPAPTPAAETKAAPPAPAEKAPAATVAPFNPAAGEGFTDTLNSQMRGAIAKRLGESKFTAPEFYVRMEVNMDNAMAARTSLNAVSPVKISFNDLVIKAAALALKKHPAVNSAWMGGFIRSYSHVHIGMAVAIPDGLIVPVIRFADQKTLSQISAEAKELGGKAKGKKLQPSEFTGSTFTVSNLGMMDVDEFTAIINPPESCILAVGKIKEVVVKKGEGFGVSNFMVLTLTCDHRSVDGAVGAAFLQTLKAYLENPVTMLV